MGKGERGGRSLIRTARELSYLAEPLYHLVIGKAECVFPNTTVSNPSSYVVLRVIGSGDSIRTPVCINWRQWDQVVVPLLEERMYPHWLGSLGATEGTGVTYEDGTEVPSEPRSIPVVSLGTGILIGMKHKWIADMKEAIYQQAVGLGY